MFSVRRPIEVVVLNCCVTETIEAWCPSKIDDLREVGVDGVEALRPAQ